MFPIVVKQHLLQAKYGTEKHETQDKLTIHLFTLESFWGGEPKVTSIQVCTATASSAEDKKPGQKWQAIKCQGVTAESDEKATDKWLKTVHLRLGRVVCPVPDVWKLGFWWHDRRLAALCAAAGHRDPSQTRAEWEWALAIAWGSPDGPPWLSVLQSGSLSVGKTQRENKIKKWLEAKY